MSNKTRDEILKTADFLCEQMALFDDESKIEIINEIRRKIHDISPLKDNPVDFVEWIKSDLVEKNNYNPNFVASPEMTALKNSITKDGYTQPIVAWDNESKYTVIDGYHRNVVGRRKELAKKLYGRLPIANIRGNRSSIKDRMQSTVAHNRARGKHMIQGMADIVTKMKQEGVSDLEIADSLGMEAEELLRLKQQTGLPELFVNAKHSRAWKNKKDLSPKELS